MAALSTSVTFVTKEVVCSVTLMTEVSLIMFLLVLEYLPLQHLGYSVSDVLNYNSVNSDQLILFFFYIYF